MDMDHTKMINECVERYQHCLVLKDKQRDCLECLLDGKDVVANLPVGYGKSLIYHLLPSLLGGIVLVVSPLNIIQQDQMDSIQKHDITCCRLEFNDNLGATDAKCDADIRDIIDGKYSIVLSHPEAILNSPSGKELLRNSEFTKKVVAVVVDECHIVEKWGKDFRTTFAQLHTLPAFFPGRPVLGLSGTITTSLRKRLPDILGLHNPVFIDENPDRPNIFLEKAEKSTSTDVAFVYEDIFKLECENLQKNPKEYPVTLLFLPMTYMSQAASFLHFIFDQPDITTSCFSVIYSRQDKDVMDITLKELKSENPRIRLILTTAVSGMGFDPEGVTRIIHAVPPRSLSQYLQEIGRAGRRGQQATALLHYNNRDLAKNLPGLEQDIVDYCRNKDSCLRTKLLSVFGFNTTSVFGCSCCMHCRKSCMCAKCLLPIFNDDISV
jgi:superfamily II DNA helicase RecQ